MIARGIDYNKKMDHLKKSNLIDPKAFQDLLELNTAKGYKIREENGAIYLVNGEGWLQVLESQQRCSRTTSHKLKKHTTVSWFKSNNYL